jgi:TRAP-type C4-dicarboxylate transport system permease small subunit
MKYQYVVILKKTGQRATDVLSIFLCLFSAFSFAYFGIRAFHRVPVRGNDGSGWTIAGSTDAYGIIAIATLLLLGLALTRVFRRRVRAGRVRYRYLLLLAAAGWMFFTPAPWVGLFFLLLTFLEHQVKRPLEVGFDKDRVVINTLFRQRFDWTAFNNVLLKDGLLTLDFKNNRLIQREVTDDDEEDDADEEEFNAYCRMRLAAVEK